MKVSALLAGATCLSAASGLSFGYPSSQATIENEKFLIETAPGETQWITEDQKWELKRAGVKFMDITTTSNLGNVLRTTNKRGSKVTFPPHPAHNKTVQAMIPNLNSSNMRADLTKFTSFWTRYYKSSYGAQSQSWLLEQVENIVIGSGAYEKSNASVKVFPHPWGQNSIIAQFPGKSEKTVVIGAHQDSINLLLPSIFAAPGADDDGSGTVTILEALRVLLTSDEVLRGEQENTIEFHWYSAEEGGLLGSQAIFQSYQKEGRDVRAMLQQDMTGYIHNTLEAGEPESVGVITDFVDPGLTEFITKVVDTVRCGVVIEEYCQRRRLPLSPKVQDHASASKAGYPAAFVIESDFKYSDKKIHTTEDKLEYLSFSHMLQHARLTLGLVYELAFAEL